MMPMRTFYETIDDIMTGAAIPIVELLKAIVEIRVWMGMRLPCVDDFAFLTAMKHWIKIYLLGITHIGALWNNTEQEL